MHPPPLLSVAEAEARIHGEPLPPRHETLPLRAAAGRRLATPVTADRDTPPINRATMDGLAIASASLAAGTRAWRLEGIAAAGTPAARLADPDHAAWRIMTGAPLPVSADRVLPVEWLDLTADTARLRADITPGPDTFVHPRGVDCRAGDLLLPAGTRLDAPAIAIAASVGRPTLTVHALPRVAVFGSGDEILPVDTPSLAPHQVRASNLEGLVAAVTLAGGAPGETGHLPDDPETIRRVLRAAICHHDLLLVSGGMSKGLYDHIPAALEAIGVQRIFHGVAQKPGKPFWFGRTDTCLVFGLPGNPVSTLTVFTRYIRPVLRPDLPPLDLPLAAPALAHPALTLFHPVTRTPAGLTPHTTHGSGDLPALATTHGLIEIPPGPQPLLPPTPVACHLF